MTTNDFTAAIQYDFNNPGAPINDGALSYHGFGPFVLTVGNFIEPFSLNALESNDSTTFTERSLMNALAPQDAFGGSIGASGNRWTATVGVFGANVIPGPGTGGVACTGRVTYAPIIGKDQVLQFGIAGSYRALSASDPAPSFSSTPEGSLFASTLVNTGALDRAADIVRAGGEALYQVGSVRVQAEYDHVDLAGRDGQAARAFQGGYVEGAWVVNGDGRPFSLKAPYGGYFALLQGVKVRDDQRISQGGLGVFELAVRFSAIDLRSGEVRRGQEQDFTTGINWYPDANVRIMADYVHARANPAAFQVGQGATVDSNIFVGRVNFYW